MAILLETNPATGGPGIEPRWTRSDKEGVGTAYSALSRVWFTVSKGILNEIYYPTIDRPQIRDLQYLITDGETFFSDERRMVNTHECLLPDALGFRITNVDPGGRYRITKEIITDPHQDCLLMHTRLEAEAEMLAKLRLFALLAPHLESGGRGNFGNVVQTNWGKVLTAHKGATWLVLAASVPFLRCSCGYAGTTDGWQDLARNFRMDWEFDCAPDGNIALTGELDIRQSREFVLALAFGESLHHTLVTVAQALGTSFTDHRARFIEQWQRVCHHMEPKMAMVTGDGGSLYHVSQNMLLAHEDKTYDGALIASLSIPWGEYTSDDLEGYYLVWTRDMCHSASGLLAAGSAEVPLRALIYLAWTQKEDGGFDQNFWINGEPHWRRIQLDETAFPIILAWRLHQAQALQNFDPYPMVLKAAGYLICHGPVTPQERWEENSGYSPSTLAVHITALICAAAFARERGQQATAQYFEEYADFLESHIESWTVTTESSLVPGIRRHFIRIHPADADDPQPDEDANHGVLELRNQPPGATYRVSGQGDRGCGVPRIGPLRHPQAGRSPDRRFAARGGRDSQGEHSLRSLLASVQPRRLWAAGRWRAIPGLGVRPRLALAYRGARALRTGCRARCAALYPGDGAFCLIDQTAARASLGLAGPAQRPHGSWPSDRGRHAPLLGACRVHQIGALRDGRPGLRHHPGGR